MRKKHIRRTGEQMETVKDAIFNFAQSNASSLNKADILQSHYPLAIVDKTENAYKQVVKISGEHERRWRVAV